MDRDYVENILLKIGVPASVKGFGYIVDALEVLDENFYVGITTELYPEVAKKNGITGERVERSIRHALGASRKMGDRNLVEHYIGFTNCQNSNSLKMLYKKIKKECEKSTEQIDITPTEDLGEDKIRRIVREELKAIMGGIV